MRFNISECFSLRAFRPFTVAYRLEWKLTSCSIYSRRVIGRYTTTAWCPLTVGEHEQVIELALLKADPCPISDDISHTIVDTERRRNVFMSCGFVATFILHVFSSEKRLLGIDFLHMVWVKRCCDQQNGRTYRVSSVHGYAPRQLDGGTTYTTTDPGRKRGGPLHI